MVIKWEVIKTESGKVYGYKADGYATITKGRYTIRTPRGLKSGGTCWCVLNNKYDTLREAKAAAERRAQYQGKLREVSAS